MRSRIARQLVWVAVPAVLLVAGTVSSVYVDAPTPPSRTATATHERPSPVREPPVATKEPVDPRGSPTRVAIPAIDVDVDLVRLGLNIDGSMEVPDFGLAGWYTDGPEPGRPGPAVIVAHVDSRAGPDVFAHLGDLTPGDEIGVVYDSGDTVTFFAGSQEQTPKGELPVAAIWPTTNERLLTLITCGGEFDRRVRHYRDNLIVYASSATPPRAAG